MNDKTKPALRPAAPPPGATWALGTPLQPSVVYRSGDPDALDAVYEGRASGYSYAREGHPNGDSLARLIDGLEGGQGGLMAGSGMAAISATLLGLLSQGDHIVAGNQLYGRSLRMLNEDLPRLGIDTSLADPTDVAEFAKAIRPTTRLLLVETVSNPTMRVADMAAITALARARGLILVVDNTFTTPRGYPAYLEGADVVIHSVTKLLAGHSDVTLGYVLARDPRHRSAIYDTITTLGLTASPYDCWMAERGIYTFDLRFERAEANAAALADHLAAHPKIAQVLYPGRADHPDRARAASVLARPGNMLSFRLHGGRDVAVALTQGMPDLAFAPTLGDVATVLSHSASSSHRGLSELGRQALGITQGFFRVSVGIEPIEGLIAQFDAGLAAL